MSKLFPVPVFLFLLASCTSSPLLSKGISVGEKAQDKIRERICLMPDEYRAAWYKRQRARGATYSDAIYCSEELTGAAESVSD